MTGGTDSIELHLQGDIAEHITVDDINNVLQKALAILKVVEHLEKQSKTKLTNVVKMSPFMSTVAS